MTNSEQWTAAELARLQSFDAARIPIPDIAQDLGRSEASIREQLPIVRARNGAVPMPPPAASAGGLEWNGPDEEGDVPPPSGRADDDPAAWVHSAKRP